MILIGMKLDSKLIEGFVRVFLVPRMDAVKAIPAFHRVLWDKFCGDSSQVVIAAPRGTAKTTAVTFSCTLASALFRDRDFILLVSKTEGQVVRFLANIKAELLVNEELKSQFGVKRFVKDTETEVIVELLDGHQFCIIAKGSEQEVRGLQWNGKRPNLIIIDDAEGAEQVMNPQRREKFRNWLFNDLFPCGSEYCKIRMVGTVLHMDSALERLLKDSMWESERFAAHNDDYSELLWPEKLPKDKLEEIRQGYINQGNPDGYSQEYLNKPIDAENAYFHRDDFIHSHTPEYLEYYAAIDFAITKKTKSDYTVIAIAGIDQEGLLHIVDIRRGRWDGFEIIENMFWVQQKYQPNLFIAEKGQIKHTLDAFLNAEMVKRGEYINLHAVTPKVDKEQRAKPLQARMRAGGVRFNKDKEWYGPLVEEMLVFPRGQHDDQVDALAYVGLALDKVVVAPTAEERWEEEYQDETVLAELAFEQYEFDAKIDITIENYDLIRQVFIDAFIKGRKTNEHSQ